MAEQNYDMVVELDTVEKKRLSNALLYEQTKSAVLAESQPTPDAMIAILERYAERRTLDEQGWDRVESRLKELNAARVALELLQPGSDVLHRIARQQNILEDMVRTSRGSK